MNRLEDLQPNAAVRGILPDSLVTVVGTEWFGSEALELTYKDPGGRVANAIRSLLRVMTADDRRRVKLEIMCAIMRAQVIMRTHTIQTLSVAQPALHRLGHSFCISVC